jgi:transcription elongation factor Elf1
MSQRLETTFICDRCNQNENAEYLIKTWGKFQAIIDVGGRKQLQGKQQDFPAFLDLCPNCSKSLWRWWTNIRE